ncbi:hypothetical protein BH10PAT3_BH10PAT3_4170 [soil metagenome]
MNELCEKCPAAQLMVKNQKLLFDMHEYGKNNSVELWEMNTGINLFIDQHENDEYLLEELNKTKDAVRRHLIFRSIVELEISEDIEAADKLICGNVPVACPRIYAYGDIIAKVAMLLEEFNNGSQSVATD